MNIEVKSSPFYKGFDYYCPDCKSLFSISRDIKGGPAHYCPVCGNNRLHKNTGGQEESRSGAAGAAV
jgi:rRNA maturation endonuclease Nob1